MPRGVAPVGRGQMPEENRAAPFIAAAALTRFIAAAYRALGIARDNGVG